MLEEDRIARLVWSKGGNSFGLTQERSLHCGRSLFLQNHAFAACNRRIGGGNAGEDTEPFRKLLGEPPVRHMSPARTTGHCQPHQLVSQARQSDLAFFKMELSFFTSFFADGFYTTCVTAETFKPEIAEALKVYEKYIVCIDKTPEEFQASLMSLLAKAIKAYESRGPHLRHGIALDRQITVILSQNDDPRPLCGIYFNLHSPYQKQPAAKTGKPVKEHISEGNDE